MRLLLPALLLAPCLVLAEEAPDQNRIRNLKIQVGSDGPPRVEVQASVQVPDQAILNVSLKTERSDIRGKHWKLVDMKRVSVSQNGFDVAFTPAALPFGTYRVEGDCDRNRQYPNVILPDGSFQAAGEFQVDFNDDIVAPTSGLADAIDAFLALHDKLEKEHKANTGKTGDKQRLEDFERFRQAWMEEVMKASQKIALPDEDLLYAETRNAIGGLGNKMQLFADLYTSELKGEKNETHEAHPNWFEPDVTADMARARQTLAREFAFNTGKKVVDYGYDKATDLLKQVKEGKASASRTWEAFQARFMKDLGHIQSGYEALSTGSLRGEIVTIACDSPALAAAGQELVQAINSEITTGKTSPALERAKDNLKKAYQSNRQKYLAADQKK